MSSPAQRYAAAARRAASPQTAQFATGYDFGLDDFQLDACRALEAGESVLVCAPTGAGKTVVGEFAVHLALAVNQKCFYTTPIKALSNQKYTDLVARYGPERVGLLTGDNSINGAADVVVMTTEVLRNMLYAGSPLLSGLGYVVLDEVHYLADRFRGAVWEEVIIHLPASVRLVALSATVSNAEEFAEWLVTVRGDTRVIVEEHRPVPLWQHVLAGATLYDLFAADVGGADGAGQVNPALTRLAREEARFRPTRPARGYSRSRVRLPSRVDVVARLDAEGLLPAINFIFSRAGAEAAVAQCLRGDLRLCDAAERAVVRAHVESRTAAIPEEDLRVLGYWEWLDGLERGIAAHHAGMLPTFKEVVEELFRAALVKVVFATETLALGVNMPARSVVLERLVKWNGEAHVDVTPGEYTQLTGRAGRRGIDVEGHAVVLWTSGFDPAQLAGLASARTYPLRSSFAPSYNMAVNLVGTLGRERARALLESSFAQFQADRAVVGLGRPVKRNLAALDGYRQAMTCHLGDFPSYAELRHRIADREATFARETSAARRAAAAASLERLRVGDVVRVPSGRRSGLAVILDPGTTANGETRPLVLTEDRWAGRLSHTDFPGEVATLARIRVPKHFNHRSPQARRDLASTLRGTGLTGPGERPRRARAAADDPELHALRTALRAHPCHRCPDREDHARWAQRYDRLRRDTDALEQRVEGRTNVIARTFDRVCGVLEGLGYLAGEQVSDAGRLLAGVYAENDLLVVECLRAGAWDDLSPPELAAVVSGLVYETRGREGGPPPRLPAGRARVALDATQRCWDALAQREADARLSFLHEPDPGFAWAAYRWADGAPLEVVLREASTGDDELPAGDFVRWVRQLIDLLSQLVLVGATSPVGPLAAQAVDALRRGVVAYSSVG